MKEILTVAFFVIGNLVGAGFFCLPIVFASLGFSMIFSWFIALSIALVYTMIFGKLAIIFPNSSVLSDYISDENIKKCVAYFYWFVAVLSNMVLVNTNELSLFGSKMLLGFVIVLIITFINHYFEYETVANIEIMITGLKFALLIFLPVFLFFSNPDLFVMSSESVSIKSIVNVGITTFWAFIGIEMASIFGKGKNVRIGLVIGVLATFILYVVSSFIIIGMVSKSELTKIGAQPFISLIQVAGYGRYSEYISYLVGFVCACTLYGWVAGASKIALSYADCGLFHEVFKKKTRSGMSLVGLWLSSFIVYILYFGCYYFDVKNNFLFIADICIYILFLLYFICAYVLYSKVQKVSKFYSYLSILGMILIFIAMCADIVKSFIAIVGFLIFYLYQLKFCKNN